MFGPLNLRTFSLLLVWLPSITILSIKLGVDRLGDFQVALWMLRCWNLVPHTTIFCAVAKSFNLILLEVVFALRLNCMIPSHPNFTLKSPKAILAAWAGHLSYTSSSLAQKVHRTFLPSGPEHKQDWCCRIFAWWGMRLLFRLQSRTRGQSGKVSC